MIKKFNEFEREYGLVKPTLNESAGLAILLALDVATWTFGIVYSIYINKQRTEAIQRILKDETDPIKKELRKRELKKLSNSGIAYKRDLKIKMDELRDNKDKLSDEEQSKLQFEIDKMVKAKSNSTGFDKIFKNFWKL